MLIKKKREEKKIWMLTNLTVMLQSSVQCPQFVNWLINSTRSSSLPSTTPPLWWLVSFLITSTERRSNKRPEILDDGSPVSFPKCQATKLLPSTPSTQKKESIPINKSGLISPNWFVFIWLKIYKKGWSNFRLKFLCRLEMKERVKDLIRRQLGKLKHTQTTETPGYIKVEFDFSRNEMYRVSLW